MTMLVRTDTLQPWTGEPLDNVRHPKTIADLWSDEELATIGLARPALFKAPKGKTRRGKPRYVRKGGKVHEAYDTEDEPSPPPPPPMPTVEERVDRMLANYGLTRDELKAALASPAAGLTPAPRPRKL